MTRGLPLVLAGFALTAVTYGLARFAYGLLLPAIRDDLGLSASAAGWIGGGAFAAYCVGIVGALWLGARIGERGVAILAGVTATVGMALVSTAQSAGVLGGAMALGGLSTGLTSPPLAAAVARCLDGAARAKANGAINAGTAAGIVFSGVAAMLIATEWREAYVVFAAIGVAVTLWLAMAVPAGRQRAPAATRAGQAWRHPDVMRLCAAAFVMGAASTAIWTFGANLMRESVGLRDAQVSLGWILLGTAGLSGSVTGVLTTRWGIAPVHRGAITAMAVALLAMALAPALPALAFGAVGLFGAAYIVSSGVLLLWGVTCFADRPDTGLALPFFLIALGQTAGAPVFGWVWESGGTAAALIGFAAAMAAAALIGPQASPSCPRVL